MFKKNYMFAIFGVIIALVGYALTSSISTGKQVDLLNYEHCLSMQNQALTMIFEEYKSLPAEDDVSSFDRILSLVKVDPETDKVEWMTTSLDICEQYRP